MTGFSLWYVKFGYDIIQLAEAETKLKLKYTHLKALQLKL
jgi:hypothetical protein